VPAADGAGWSEAAVSGAIRDTLAHTKRATFAVVVKGAKEEAPNPVGTGFFVSEEGLFATAAHVVEDVTPLRLSKESGGGADPSIGVEREYVFYDRDADFALLQGIPDRDREGEFGRFTWLRPSELVLDEADPVYAFGYPLTEFGAIPFTPDQLHEILGDGPADLLSKIGPSQVFSLPNWVLSPRTTSAIVASEIAFSRTFDPRGDNDRRDLYVLDKALNYGNSGGPILATKTGHAMRSALRFSPS
jgi:serine protease Do